MPKTKRLRSLLTGAGLLLIAALVFTLFVINRPTSVYHQMCRSVWAEMSDSQKRVERSYSDFEETCLKSLYISKCEDGTFDRANNDKPLCRAQGGEADMIKFPDA